MDDPLTAAEMRAIERAAIESGAVTGLELMERAGQGVVAAALAEWPVLAAGPRRAVVLAGPGNNGGDGFVVARLLVARGWSVQVFLYCAADRLPADAAANRRRWAELGPVDEVGFPEVDPEAAGRLGEALGRSNGGPDLVVDALFGTGLTRPASGLGPIFDLHGRLAGDGERRTVAVDIPTGLCSDSGRLYPATAQDGPHAVLPADLTVTFHRPKFGHYLDRGPEVCGKLRVVPIGIEAFDERPPRPEADQPPLQKRQGHKFDHGSALVLSGGVGRGGAARLAARGALRVGAGLVTVGCPPAALIENAAQLDAIMLRPVADAAALARRLEDGRIRALCLGPGLGTGEREAGLVAAALDWCRGPDRALVLDGDALTLVAQSDALFSALSERCVLTPHADEFARLFPDIAGQLAAPSDSGPLYSKADATREAAARAGCVVLFKGADTVVAAPDGTLALNAACYEDAAPWLATAGSGDVLAGIACGLLARGFSGFAAALQAARLHLRCALSFGPGLVAEDLPEELPKVFRSLGS